MYFMRFSFTLLVKGLKLGVLTFLLCAVGLAAYAQQTITGVVVDETGAPLMGATVMVKGTIVGTTTVLTASTLHQGKT